MGKFARAKVALAAVFAVCALSLTTAPPAMAQEPDESSCSGFIPLQGASNSVGITCLARYGNSLDVNTLMGFSGATGFTQCAYILMINKYDYSTSNWVMARGKTGSCLSQAQAQGALGDSLPALPAASGVYEGRLWVSTVINGQSKQYALAQTGSIYVS